VKGVVRGAPVCGAPQDEVSAGGPSSCKTMRSIAPRRPRRRWISRPAPENQPGAMRDRLRRRGSSRRSRRLGRRRPTTLPTPFDASGGTNHWVGPISVSTNFNPFFSWSASTVQPLDAFSAQQVLGGSVTNWYTVPDDRAFSLSTVPEPSTWAMMLLGFVGLGLVGYGRGIRLA
jgi:PEP-CTERM motif